MKRSVGVSILGMCILVAMPGCAGMTLQVKQDSFGTFQPINNQWRGGPNIAYRSGVLLQLSDFADAGHAYKWIKLYSRKELVQTIPRGSAAWVDIECGVTDSQPITPDQAALMRGDPNHPDRRLHKDMTLGKELIPITLWEPEKGIEIHMTRFFMDAGDIKEVRHGHQRYVMTTDEKCAVRVWDDQQQMTKSYAAGAIRRIVVGEDEWQTIHGGPHSPPWLIE